MEEVRLLDGNVKDVGSNYGSNGMSKRTASQVGKMSRRKGKSFERWCARYFTQWTGLKWETTRNSGRTDLKGDIYCLSRPDLPLVVECKHDKRYSVHAMLKPTKAFADLISKHKNRYEQNKYKVKFIMLIKNETSVWYYDPQLSVYDLITCDRIWVERLGVFIKLECLAKQLNIDGVRYSADRMDSVGEECEG